MAKQKSSKELAKFLFYVLGRRPDEFGLIPDSDGYVRIKELLKALNEEEGWRHVRRSGIEEIVLTLPDSPLQILENRVRAKEREQLPEIRVAENLPKLLYTCVRRKAHPHVPEKGIFPLGGLPWVILSSEKQMALRIGKRLDSSPVLLTVQVAEAGDTGVVFRSFGEQIYLAESLPSGCFTAPPPPKEKEVTKKKEKEKTKESVLPKTPGSFFIDFPDPEEKKRERLDRRKKEMQRGKEKKLRRKQKEKENMWKD